MHAALQVLLRRSGREPVAAPARGISRDPDDRRRPVRARALPARNATAASRPAMDRVGRTVGLSAGRRDERAARGIERLSSESGLRRAGNTSRRMKRVARFRARLPATSRRRRDSARAQPVSRVVRGAAAHRRVGPARSSTAWSPRSRAHAGRRRRTVRSPVAGAADRGDDGSRGASASSSSWCSRVAAALTVANVVRLAAHARRDEIEIMQLVGAPLGLRARAVRRGGCPQGGVGALDGPAAVVGGVRRDERAVRSDGARVAGSRVADVPSGRHWRFQFLREGWRWGAWAVSSPPAAFARGRPRETRASTAAIMLTRMVGAHTLRRIL